MGNRRHLNQVESLRAFAAISVAIFHFSAYFDWNPQMTLNFTFGAQGVEIFYMISGFIIPYSLYHSNYRIDTYFRYMGKRLSRLLPPYLATIILIQLIGIVLCTYLWGCIHDINFRQIAINVFFLADLFPNYDWINPIFTTLKVELQFYLLIGVLFPFIKNNNWALSVVGLILLAAGIITKNYDTVLVNSPYFICGVSLFFIKEKGWSLQFIVPALAAFTSLFICYMWQDLAVAVIGFSLLLWLPTSFRFLTFTGKISYSYYLVHGLSGGWFLYFTSKTAFAMANPVLMIAAALSISWIVSFFLYWFVERPSMRISKRIKYGK